MSIISVNVYFIYKHIYTHRCTYIQIYPNFLPLTVAAVSYLA